MHMSLSVKALQTTHLSLSLYVHSVLYVTHPMNSFWYVLFILTSFGMYWASSLWQ